MTRNIIAAVDDMVFASKIRATAEALDVNVKFHRRLEGLVSAAQENSTDLVLVDLHNEKINPLELARQFKSNEELQSIPLLGFFSHVQTDLRMEALEAGFDHVVPRSVFARDLATILAGDKQKPDR
jgi:PleD family two-component response regulator